MRTMMTERGIGASGKWQGWCWVGLLWMGLLSGLGMEAATTQIQKVLPHLLDEEGRHTLSPSLYERDAYQAYLRRHPEKVGAVRFDVQWKVRRAEAYDLRMRIEVRGSVDPAVHTLEERVRRRPWYNRWSSITLEGEGLRAVGEVVAWRVTLWSGTRLLAEHRSFLW
jgi:hypothetical protein